MTLQAVAVVPHPPVLIPEVAAGAATELAGLRRACAAAVGAVVATGPDVILIVGGGAQTVAAGPGDWGSLDGYGVPTRVALGARICSGQGVLPLSLTVGAWLVQQAGWTGDTQGFALAPVTRPGSLAEHVAGPAAEIAGLAGRVGLVVCGDATATRSPAAPGGWDPRSAAFDAAIATALAQVDTAALLAVDPDLAAELGVAGTQAWALLAAALARDSAAVAGRAWQGRLLADEAPYGVGYLVASWLPGGSGEGHAGDDAGDDAEPCR